MVVRTRLNVTLYVCTLPVLLRVEHGSPSRRIKRRDVTLTLTGHYTIQEYRHSTETYIKYLTTTMLDLVRSFSSRITNVLHVT
jgi:hypothetical protein